MRLARRVDPLAFLALVLFAVALALSLATASSAERELVAGRTASVYDDSPGGASVLRRYLVENGVRVSTLEGARFGPITTDVVFLLGATDAVDANAARVLRDHVESGGTLVLATDLGLNERDALAAFGLRLAGGVEPGERAVHGVELAMPPVRRIAVARASRFELPPRGEALTAGGAVVGTVPVGRGVVVAVGSLDPFLNRSIGTADNARFALALARLGASVAFDEHHHGVRPEPDPLALLVRTWPGVALLAAAATTFIYLALSGRRLGPPIPLDPRPPRSSLDYVRAFAGLVRRSGHAEIARRRLRDDLRHRVARMVGADPQTPIERMAQALDPVRAAEVVRIDEALAGPLRDVELLRTVARIEALTSDR